MIQLEHISKIYNSHGSELRALDDVSLTIQQGDFVAILGASGSGKSTLMNIIGCLDVADQGNYFLDGELLSNIKPTALDQIRAKKIGFIFQSFNLIPSLNALENVMLPLSYRKVPKSSQYMLAKKALLQVGLQERMEHTPAQMSGGQQQRVAIARAIALSPPIILADEPTGNLDRESTQEVMKILKDLNEEGKTIVLITHDSVVADIATKTFHVSYGKLI